MLQWVPFPDEHFARGQSPFFRLLAANAIFVLDVRKEGNPSELAHQLLAVRYLCNGPQNGSKY